MNKIIEEEKKKNLHALSMLIKDLTKDFQERYDLSDDDIKKTFKGIYREKDPDQMMGEFLHGKEEEPEEE